MSTTWIIVIVVVLLLLVLTAALVPMARRGGRGVEEMSHHEMDRQFERPSNESELL